MLQIPVQGITRFVAFSKDSFSIGPCPRDPFRPFSISFYLPLHNKPNVFCIHFRKHLLEALGDSGVPATCDDGMSGFGSGDEDFEVISGSGSGNGSGVEEEMTIEEMKEEISYMVKELQRARKKLRAAIMKRKEMKKAEREAKRAARKNKKEQRKKNKMGGGKKMGAGKKMMGGNDKKKNMSMGGSHDGH